MDDIIDGLIVTPAKAKALGHRYVEELSNPKNKKRGISSGIRSLDTVMNPLLPGQLMVVMARPGGGKTSLMMHFVRESAKAWSSRDKKETIPPIAVSAEMAIEEIILRDISHHLPVDSNELSRGTYGDWEMAHKIVDKMYDEFPVIYIGHTLEKTGRRPRMSIENIWKSLAALREKYQMSPELVSIDYVQRLKLDKISRDRRGEVSEITEMCKDLALEYATPVILGSQVGRQVEDRKPPIPTLQDAKETANLEETADVILSLMRPSKYYQVGEKIPGTKDGMMCTEELFYINLIKQRQGVGDKGFWCHFDMAISRLSDLEFIDMNESMY